MWIYGYYDIFMFSYVAIVVEWAINLSPLIDWIKPHQALISFVTASCLQRILLRNEHFLRYRILGSDRFFPTFSEQSRPLFLKYFLLLEVFPDKVNTWLETFNRLTGHRKHTLRYSYIIALVFIFVSLRLLLWIIVNWVSFLDGQSLWLNRVEIEILLRRSYLRI